MSFVSTPIADAIAQFQFATGAPDPRHRRREHIVLTNGTALPANKLHELGDELLLRLFGEENIIAYAWHVGKVATRANGAWCTRNFVPKPSAGKVAASFPPNQIVTWPMSEVLRALTTHTTVSGTILAAAMQKPSNTRIVGGAGCWALTMNSLGISLLKDNPSRYGICVAMDRSKEEPGLGVMFSRWFMQQVGLLVDDKNPCFRVGARIGVNAPGGGHALFIKIDAKEQTIVVYDPNGAYVQQDDYPHGEAALAAACILKEGIGQKWASFKVSMNAQMSCQRTTHGELEGSCIVWSCISFDVSILAQHAPNDVLGVLSAQLAHNDSQRGVNGNDIVRAYASMRVDNLVAECIRRQSGVDYTYDWLTGHLRVSGNIVATFFLEWEGMQLERASKKFRIVYIFGFKPDYWAQELEAKGTSAMEIEDMAEAPHRADIAEGASLVHDDPHNGDHCAMVYCSWLVALFRQQAARRAKFPDEPFYATAAELYAEMVLHHPATVAHYKAGADDSMDTSPTTMKYSNHFYV